MNLTFTSGTTEQKGLWQGALGLLLHLPLDAVPLTIHVSFVPPKEVGQTSFAETTWSLGSAVSTTKVRNDAPGFGSQDAALMAEAAGLGLDYIPEKHFNETAVHETGHSVFAALSSVRRLEILNLFHAEPSELSQPGRDWRDQLIEGIAETFKEAFLPARYRVFPNRTNVAIPYSLYPEFRRIVRGGLEEVEVAGTPVPAYDFDVFGQGGVLPGETSVYIPSNLSFPAHLFNPWVAGGLDTYDTLNWGPIEASDNTLYRNYLAKSATEMLLVPRGTRFAGAIELPQDVEFFGPSLDFAPSHGAHFGEKGYFGAFTWKELEENPEFNNALGEPFNGPLPEKIMGVIAVSIAFAYFNGTKWVAFDCQQGSILGFEPSFASGNPHPNFPGITSTFGCWIIVKGDNRSSIVLNEGDQWSIPIGTLSLDSLVPEGAPTISTCGGDRVRVRIFADVEIKTSVSRQDSIATIQSRQPSFNPHRPAAPCKGGPISVPGASVTPAPGGTGTRPSLRPVGGGYGPQAPPGPGP